MGGALHCESVCVIVVRVSTQNPGVGLTIMVDGDMDTNQHLSWTTKSSIDFWHLMINFLVTVLPRKLVADRSN